MSPPYRWKAEAPPWISAPLVPFAAFYLIAFILWAQGGETMGRELFFAFKSWQFWIFYILPVSLVVIILKLILPYSRRSIEWTTLALLCIGMYLIAPSVSS